MKKSKFSKRLLAGFLTAVMIATLIPSNNVFAENTDGKIELTDDALIQEDTSDVEIISEEKDIIEEKDIAESDTKFLIEEDGASEAITRIDWLKYLISTFEMVVEEDNYPDNYYADIDTSYADYESVMIATEFGLVDVNPGEDFDPNGAVTREFAAHSLNMCLGYVPTENETSFSDEVRYPIDCQVAVENEWFNLDGTTFGGKTNITGAEFSALKSKVTSVLESDSVASGNTYSYKDSVKVLNSETEIETLGNNQLKIVDYASCGVTISSGDVFGIVYDGMPLAWTAESVNNSGDDLIVDISNIDMEDAFSSLNVSGKSEVDLDDIRLASESATMYYVVGGTEENNYQDGQFYSSLEELGALKADAIIIEDEVVLSQDEMEGDVGGTINTNIDGIKVKYNASISDFEWDWSASLVSAFIDVDFDVNYSVSFEGDLAKMMGADLNLCTIPICPGLNYVAGIDFNVKGSLTANYVEHVKLGAHWNVASGLRFTKKFYKKSYTVTAELTGTAGFHVNIEADYLVMDAMLYAKIGCEAKLKRVSYDDGMDPRVCTNISLWLYARVGYDFNICKGKVFSNSDYYDVYEQQNSPIKVAAHYEDGTQVEKCTNPDRYKEGNEESVYPGYGAPKPGFGYFSPLNTKYYYNGKSSSVGGYTTFTYSVNKDDTLTITGYSGTASNVIIPETLDDKTVTAIGAAAFENKKITSVIMADSITTIGNRAFMGCTSLSKVMLSSGLTKMEYGAFQGCTSLREITIPKSLVDSSKWNETYAIFKNTGLKKVQFEDGVTIIPEALFSLCDTLQEITIPDTVTEIKSFAFYKCSSLEKINIPDSVTSIGNDAFEGCTSLTEAIIGSGCEKIGCHAFSSCNKLSNVELNEGIKKLEYGAFQNCISLTEIFIPKSLEEGSRWNNVYGVFTDSGLKKVEFAEGVTEIPKALFSNCDSLEEITIPESVTVIEAEAFQNSHGLKKIIIPDFVTEVQERAFQDCTALAEVTIGSSVRSIGSFAFYKTDITEINIPASVTKVGAQAFYGCKKLGNITLNEGLKKIEYGAFQGCEALTEIVIPKSLVEASKWNDTYAIFMNTGLKKVDFAKGVTIIPEALFALCGSLEEITIPDTVEKIEKYAFYKCTALKKIEIPDSVTVIGGFAFDGCSSMKSAVIGNSVLTLGTYSFINCSSLESVKIGESVTNIENKSFEGCKSLKEVTIPENVSTLGDEIFRSCSGLEKVEFLGDKITTIPSSAFRQCEVLSDITLPSSVKNINTYAFYDCNSLVDIVLPNSVTTLGTYVFAHCDKLNNVTLSNRIKEIPSYAFDLCAGLESIILPYGITTLKANSFTNCTKLTEITVPRSVTFIASGTFSYISKMKVYGVSKTYAQEWAENNGATFVAINNPVTKITLSDSEITLVVSGTKELNVDIEPLNCTDEISWKSLDESVATVSETGLVKGLKIGQAKIKVVVGDNMSAICTANVVQPVTSISLNKKSADLDAGDTLQLTATVNPSAAKDKTVTWSSSNEEIATVSETGLVTAISKGTATIKATANDGSNVSGSCSITVKNTMHICESVDELESAHNYDNNCSDIWVYCYEGAEYIKVTFNENTMLEEDADFLYIYDKSGKEVGKYTGNQLAGTTIDITGDTVKIKLVTDSSGKDWGFKVDSVTSSVKPVALKSITLDKSELRIQAGKSEQLTVEYNPENTTVTKNPKWESSDPSVATVANGRVTAVAVGTAVIKATLDGKEATCNVTVTPVLESLTVSVVKNELRVGDTTKINVNIEPAKYASMFATKVECTSGDGVLQLTNKILTDGYIVVKALKTGSATVKVDVAGTSKDVTISVLDNKIKLYDDDVLLGTITANRGEVLSALFTPKAKAGKVFVGWFTGKNGTGTQVTSATVMDDQWVLYAYYKNSQEEIFEISEIPECEYTGAAVKPQIFVYDGATELLLGKDYTITYKNNTNAYTYKEGDLNFDSKKAPSIIIKGKGTYEGTLTKYFIINPKSIADEDVVIDMTTLTKTISTKPQKLVPTIKWGTKTLKNNKDFTLEHDGDCLTAGEYAITITGSQNYTGTRDTEMKLVNKNVKLASKLQVKLEYTRTPYTGGELYPNVQVFDGRKPLTEDIDYSVEYENNILPGTASIYVTGISSAYAGVKKSTFTIVGNPINAAKVNGLKTMPYTGAPIEIDDLTLTYKNVEGPLTESVDYELTYLNNVKVGTATIVIKGKGLYSGSTKKTFKILGADISNATIAPIGDVTFTKGGCMPKITAVYEGVVLREGVDYKLSYVYNKAIAEEGRVNASGKDISPAVTVIGIGNYRLKTSVKFGIVAKNLDEINNIYAADVIFKDKDNNFGTKLVVTDSDGKNLANKTDYEAIFYKDDVNSPLTKYDRVAKGDVIKVLIKAAGPNKNGVPCNYSGQKEISYRVVGAANDISKATIKILNKKYTGKKIEITSMSDFDSVTVPQIKIDGVVKELKLGEDFEVISYVNNTNKGTATVYFRGINDYSGTKKVTFKIVNRSILSIY